MNADTIKPNGYTIFCDDIRHEIDGRLSLIGAYASEIIVKQAFPVIFPKFAFLINFRIPIHQCPKDNIIINIFAPGEEKPIVKGDINKDNIIEAFKRNPPSSDKEYILISTNVIISPLQIIEEGYIKVRAICDGDTIKLGSIAINRRKNATE